jgi:hypothetical protein
MSQSEEIPSPGAASRAPALRKRGLAAGKTLGILEQALKWLELIALTRTPLTSHYAGTDTLEPSAEPGYFPNLV